MQEIAKIMTWLWRSWKKTIHSINDAIAFVLMAISYIIAVTPVHLGFRVVSQDILDRGLGDPQAKTYWKKIDRADDSDNIRRVQRQY